MRGAEVLVCFCLYVQCDLAIEHDGWMGWHRQVMSHLSSASEHTQQARPEEQSLSIIFRQ